MPSKDKPSWKIPTALKKEQTRRNPYYPLLLLLQQCRETKEELEKEGRSPVIVRDEVLWIFGKIVNQLEGPLLKSIFGRRNHELFLSAMFESLPGYDLVNHPPDEKVVFKAVIEALKSLSSLDNKALAEDLEDISDLEGEA